jgi:hypothetical protein
VIGVRGGVVELVARSALLLGWYPVVQVVQLGPEHGDTGERFLHFQRLTNLRLDRRASKERMREQVRNLYRSIHTLSKKGIKNAQVARELGIHRHTVPREDTGEPLRRRD